MAANDFWVVGITSLVLLGGGAIFVLGMRNISRAIASYHWPTVPGVVAQSDSTVSVTRNSDNRGSSTMYSADIRFRYKVGGTDYSTDTLHFGQTAGSGDSSEAELRMSRYPVGGEVTVFYNPKDPSIAAVEPGFAGEALLLPAAGMAFVLPGVMILLLYFNLFGGGSERGGSGFGAALSIFAGIFTTLGVAFLTMGLMHLWRARQSEHWPSVPGVITYDKVDGGRAPGPRVIYRYEVDGKTRFNNIRRFGQLAGQSGDWAQDIAGHYEVGKQFPVFYDPENPSLSVLKPGIASEAFWLPGAGAAFLFFGLAVFIWGIPALTKGF
jgi:hypothetical protein